MTWPTDQTTASPEKTALSINANIVSTLAFVRAWRATIAANSAAASDVSRDAYAQIAALRQYLSDNKGVPGLAAAVKALYTQASPTFDPVAEFVTVKAALDDFITWFQTNWPKTAAGNPSFDSYNGTGQLATYSVAMTGTTKSTVLAKIDALLATFS